jgi:processive 1,2-diacylglycerol beta-glucosyltransferase
MRPRARKRFGRLGLGDYDLVAATQYNALEVASDWKANTGRSLRLACVITDYDTYPLWAKRAADLFLVAHEDLVAPLERLGVSRDRIRASGIPVATAFHEPREPRRTRADLGLRQDRPVALVFGGGVGAGPMQDCIRSALDARGWQVVAVCGRNEGLRRHLVPLAQSQPARLRVLGYREDVAALMAASDMVITKGGGLSLTEALYTGARVIAMPSLPGQERANIAFMKARGWLETCDDPRDLRGMLEGHRDGERRPCPLPPEPARTAAALLHQLAGPR